MGVNLELIQNMVSTELKIKYKSSVLGFLWTFIEPLTLVFILLLVFTKLFRYNIPNYPTYLLLGFLVWGYFSEATNSALKSIVRNGNLIKKTNFPKKILIISSNLVSLIDFILKFFILLLILYATRFFFDWPSLIFIEKGYFVLFIIFMQALLILGISLMLSSIYVYLKDIENIWNIVLGVGFFATPIIYPKTIIPLEYHFIFDLNPMTYFIEIYRKLLIYTTFPDIVEILAIIFFTLFFLIFGYITYNKLKHRFAELV